MGVYSLSPLQVDNLNFDSQTLRSTSADGDIHISASDSVYISSKVTMDNIEINDNTISALDTDGSLFLSGADNAAVHLTSSQVNIQDLGIHQSTVRALNADGNVAIIPSLDGKVKVKGSAMRVGDLYFSGNTIYASGMTEGNIDMSAQGSGRLRISSPTVMTNIHFEDNTMSVLEDNGNFVISPNGDGKLVVDSSRTHFGGLKVHHNKIASDDRYNSVTIAPSSSTSGTAKTVLRNHVAMSNILIDGATIAAHTFNDSDIVLGMSNDVTVFNAPMSVANLL